MNTTLWISNAKHFGKNFIPAEGQVHVLLVAPPGVGSKRPAEAAPDDILKRLRKVEVSVEAIKPELASIKPTTLTDLEKLSVSEDEFQLDSLSMTRQTDRPIVMTPGLHEFWKEFGEFPPYYFVRTEEVVFWKVIKKMLFGEDRVVVVGSPGVGKSCFLMLIAFYLACIEKKRVLVIRRLKQRQHKNAVVFFDGQGSYARRLDLSSNDILAIRDLTKGAVVLVDDFNQTAVEEVQTDICSPFDFLATACQFNVKQDDNARIVVLPAWRDVDLLQYAKVTNWVVDTGLRKIKRQDTPLLKLVKEQYFYSGGSLREFCNNRERLKTRVTRDCRSVDRSQAFDLMYNYGGGQATSQVDRLRRHYIADCNIEEHYHESEWWKLCVDSGYVLNKLGRIVDTDKQLEIYKYAKSVGAGFLGVAYELLLHNAVHGALANRKPIVLKMREGSEYEKLKFWCRTLFAVAMMRHRAILAWPHLERTLTGTPTTYFFPFIDAVTTCEAFRGGSGGSETIVVYIQVTIRREKKFKKERLRRLNQEMDKNQSLKGLKRAFVVVALTPVSAKILFSTMRQTVIRF